MGYPEIVIDPVGSSPRYDLYASHIPGSACGYTYCLAEAEAWKDGIERIIKQAYREGYQIGLKNNTYMSEKTIGEERVRTDFNVNGSFIVDEIKQKSAELINICEPFKSKDARLASLAQTAYEEAAMWAVKAATA